MYKKVDFLFNYKPFFFFSRVDSGVCYRAKLVYLVGRGAKIHDARKCEWLHLAQF